VVAAVIAEQAADRLRWNISWITERIAMGGRLPGAGPELSEEVVAHLGQALQVGAVVDLRAEECDDAALLRGGGIEFLHLPTRDCCAVAAEMIDLGVDWVGQQLAARRRVYIHCEHGIGRSALLTCSVLVSQGQAPLQALALAKRARIQVSPSPEQLQAFIEFTERWRRASANVWPVPSFDELAAIAYSHLAGTRTDAGVR
jgi:protein-tyrosine phosphatase